MKLLQQPVVIVVVRQSRCVQYNAILLRHTRIATLGRSRRDCCVYSLPSVNNGLVDSFSSSDNEFVSLMCCFVVLLPLEFGLYRASRQG